MKKTILTAIIALTAFTGCASDYHARGYTNPLPSSQYRPVAYPGVIAVPSQGITGYNYGNMSFINVPNGQTSAGYRHTSTISCVQVGFMTSCY